LDPQTIANSRRGYCASITHVDEQIGRIVEAPSRQLDGDSMLKPARNRATPWRQDIDLEHNICYSPMNNWNALTRSL